MATQLMLCTQASKQSSTVILCVDCMVLPSIVQSTAETFDCNLQFHCNIIYCTTVGVNIWHATLLAPN